MIKKPKKKELLNGQAKVKEVAEDAKDAVKGAIEGVKNIVKKDDK